jgi:hypothetical protein
MAKKQKNYKPAYKKGYQTGVKALRNLRIVALHNDGMTFDDIAKKLMSEGHPKISRQAIHGIYQEWKDVPFRWENDKVIIH